MTMPNDVVSHQLEMAMALVTTSSAAWVAERQLKQYTYENTQHM